MYCFYVKIMIFLLFVFCNLGFAKETGIIESVSIQGNRALTKQKILDLLHLKINHNFSSNLDASSFRSLFDEYYNHGYYLVKIDSLNLQYNADSSRVHVFIKIHEGEALKINNQYIHVSDLKWKSQIQEQLSLSRGDVFYFDQLSEDFDYILDFFQNNGYPLAQIDIDSILINPPEIDLSIKVDLGSPITLSNILFRGNQYTNPNYLIRETRLKKGQQFKYKKLQQARDHLSRLSIFSHVEDPEIQFDENQATVIYQVKEGNASIVDGVLGYIPPKTNEKQGTVTGRLQFEFRNILGTGRFLEAYWEKKDKYSQAMRFGYKEPWVLGYPIHAGFQFSQEIRDTTYLEREVRIPIVYAPFTSLELSLEGGQRSVLPDSMGSLIYNVPKSEMWFFSLRARYNTFDDLLNPKKGVSYHTLFTLGKKTNHGPDFLVEALDLRNHVEDRRIELDLEAVFPVFNRQALFLGLHGAEIKSEGSFIPISDQIRLGGAKTLRGYEEDFFRGTLVTWMNTEYRYFIGRQSRAFVFFDAGYFQRKESDIWIRNTKLGYGFGLRLETRLGLLGIDYGLGEGDAPLQGKIHVGMVNRF